MKLLEAGHGIYQGIIIEDEDDEDLYVFDEDVDYSELDVEEVE